jgi:sRNA-binding protein
LHDSSTFWAGKYPFIGLLEGELYDKDGNPTEALLQARERIKEAKVEAEIQKKRTREKIAERKRRDAERKAAGEKPRDSKPRVVQRPKEQKAEEL